MTEFLTQIPMFPLVFTLGIFQFGLWLQKKTKCVLLNPILVSAAIIAAFLLLSGVPNSLYQEGMGRISWFLTPATVCLALPLYENIRILKNNLVGILVGIFAGALTSVASVSLLCHVFALPQEILVSLLPKSITTALGLAVCQQLGGIQALTSSIISITGIIGSVTGVTLCRIFRISDPISQGVAFGTASHMIGTSKASEISPLVGAVSTLSLVVSGILTTVACPFLFGG